MVVRLGEDDSRVTIVCYEKLKIGGGGECLRGAVVPQLGQNAGHVKKDGHSRRATNVRGLKLTDLSLERVIANPEH